MSKLIDGLTLTAQIHGLTGGTARQRELYRRGVELFLWALKTEEFKYRVTEFGFNAPSTGEYLEHFKKPVGGPNNSRMENVEIYDLILSGWDSYNREKDDDIDVKSTLYFSRFSSAVGYTYPNTFKNWANTKFWVGTEEEIVARIAGNLAHEYMHNLGFGHAYHWNDTRDFTVPYAIGTIVKEIVQEELELRTDEKDMVRECYRWFFFWTRCKWVPVNKNF